jgi:hypothetical protein
VRLHQGEIEFDDVRADHVEQSQRIWMRANVIEGDQEAVGADVGELAQQRPGVRQQTAFGELERHPEVLTGVGERGERTRADVGTNTRCGWGSSSTGQRASASNPTTCPPGNATMG